MQIEPAAHQNLRLKQSGVATAQNASANDFANILVAIRHHSSVGSEQVGGDDPHQAPRPKPEEAHVREAEDDDQVLNLCCANAEKPDQNSSGEMPWHMRVVAFQARLGFSVAAPYRGAEHMETGLPQAALPAPTSSIDPVTAQNAQTLDRGMPMQQDVSGADAGALLQDRLYKCAERPVGTAVADASLLDSLRAGAGSAGGFVQMLQAVSYQGATGDKKNLQVAPAPQQEHVVPRTAQGEAEQRDTSKNFFFDRFEHRQNFVSVPSTSVEGALAVLKPTTDPADGDASLSEPTTSLDDILPNRQTEAPFAVLRSSAVVQYPRLDSVFMSALRDAMVAVDAGRQIELDMGSDMLGKLRLSIQITDGSLLVTLISGRPEALDMLRRNIGLLVQDLSGQGFRDVKIDLGPNLSSQSNDPALQAAFSDSTALEFSKIAPRPSTQFDKRF
jgi:hypothetical protein